MLTRFLFSASVAGASILAGCALNGSGANVAAPSIPRLAGSPGVAASVHRTLTTPALIALDDDTGRLEYWPLHRGGSANAHWLSHSLGIEYSPAMVANGDQLYIASSQPPGITTYNVDTKATGSLAIPYGTPLDLAIDKTRHVVRSYPQWSDRLSGRLRRSLPIDVFGNGVRLRGRR